MAALQKSWGWLSSEERAEERSAGCTLQPHLRLFFSLFLPLFFYGISVGAEDRRFYLTAFCLVHMTFPLRGLKLLSQLSRIIYTPIYKVWSSWRQSHLDLIIANPDWRGSESGLTKIFSTSDHLVKSRCNILWTKSQPESTWHNKLERTKVMLRSTSLNRTVELLL